MRDGTATSDATAITYSSDVAPTPSGSVGTSDSMGDPTPMPVEGNLMLELGCGSPAEDADYLCHTTLCSERQTVTDLTEAPGDLVWTLPGDGSVTYDVDVQLEGELEDYPYAEAEEAIPGGELSVVRAPDPGQTDVNLYKLRVGEATYFLNSGSGSRVFTLNASFSLDALPGGTEFRLEVASTDCKQISLYANDEPCPLQYVRAVLTGTPR